MLVQGFDSATASIQDLVDLCERLECAEEIYSGGVNPTNKKQKTGQCDQSAWSAQKSGANQPAGGAEAPRKKQKTCPLHGPGHSMEECKVMQAQAKRMKAAHETAPSGYRPRFKGKNKRGNSSDEEVNAIVKEAVKLVLKRKKKSSEGDKEEEEDLYNFDDLVINRSSGEDPD